MGGRDRLKIKQDRGSNPLLPSSFYTPPRETGALNDMCATVQVQHCCLKYNQAASSILPIMVLLNFHRFASTLIHAK